MIMKPEAMKADIPTVLERRATIEMRPGANGLENLYDVSFSSEAPVSRMFGQEVLVHTAESVDMSRAAAGLPFLVNHNGEKLIGRIENFRVENKRTRGRLTFDADDPVAMLWKGKVDKKIATDTSLRYQVDINRVEVKSREGEELDIVYFHRWTPLEGSIVSVPADLNVGIGRSLKSEGIEMTEEGEVQAGHEQGSGVIDIRKFRDDMAAARSAGEIAATSIERRRISDIDHEFDALSQEYKESELFSGLRRRCVDEGSDINQTRQAILDMINSDPGSGPVARPSAQDQRSSSFAPGEDAMEKFCRGATEALEHRFKVDESPELAKRMSENPYSGLRMVEIGREYLKLMGVNAGAMNPFDVASASLTRQGLISHSSSDYTQVLANIANKMLGRGYTQNAETWRPLITEVNLPDYKEGTIPSLTSFTDLLEIPDNGEYKSGTLGEVGEPIKMRTFGRLYSIGRQAILNDDQNAFTRIPRLMGNAAARKVGDLVWKDIIIANPVLTQNNQNLFSAANKNLAGTGGLPNVTTLNAAFAAMRTQMDPEQRATLNVVPAYLMCPAALEGTVRVLTAAVFQRANAGVATSENLVTEADNRFAILTPIVEPRLDADNPASWYLSADPNAGIVDGIALAFVNGQQSPFMEQQQGFDQDGVRYKIRLEATAAPVAYQGLYKNPGS